MRVGLVETIQPTAAVAHDDAQLGVALEDVTVTQELGGQVLLGVKAELVVVGHHAEASVERVGAVDDDRQAPLLAPFVQRVPVLLVHARCRATAAGIRTGVGRNEAQIFNAALELGEDVTSVGRIAQLRQLGGAREALGKILALRVDAVVDEPRPGRGEVLLHEAHHAEGTRPDDLDVNVALVHVVDVTL